VKLRGGKGNAKRPLSASCLSRHWHIHVRQETGNGKRETGNGKREARSKSTSHRAPHTILAANSQRSTENRETGNAKQETLLPTVNAQPQQGTWFVDRGAGIDPNLGTTLRTAQLTRHTVPCCQPSTVNWEPGNGKPSCQRSTDNRKPVSSTPLPKSSCGRAQLGRGGGFGTRNSYGSLTANSKPTTGDGDAKGSVKAGILWLTANR
jgi:hypothetical protein